MQLKTVSNKISLYCNTVKYLKVSQVFYMLLRSKILKHKFLNNIQKNKYDIQNIENIFIPELDEDEKFLSKFNYTDISNKKFTFLFETHFVELAGWKADAKPLWNYNLYYFEYCIYLANEWRKTKDEKYYILFKEIVHSWILATSPEHISWQPYPMSLRIINWIICISMFGMKVISDETFFTEIINSLYIQYRTLLLRQEKWLLGNHYFENLFSIVIGSIFFKENKILVKYEKKLKRETKKQILEDGMHYELSPMYHKVILTDLIRLYSVSLQYNFKMKEWILLYLSKMKNVLLFLEEEFDTTPLFNDSGDNVARRKEALLLALKKFSLMPFSKEQLTSAGYYKIKNSNCCVLIDAGKIGPSYMPGHGHCDCLSFEMSIKGMKVLGNSGTYQYQGKYRNYFRSTRAHNTVMMDNHEQSQCWGEHRVAKRISRIKAKLDDNTFTGEYINYCGQKHKRNISLLNNKLIVSDTGYNVKMFSSFLHILPEYEINDSLAILLKKDVIAKIKPLNAEVIIHRKDEMSHYSSEFGKLQNGVCIEFFWNNDNKFHGYEIEYNIGEKKL